MFAYKIDLFSSGKQRCRGDILQVFCGDNGDDEDIIDGC